MGAANPNLLAGESKRAHEPRSRGAGPSESAPGRTPGAFPGIGQPSRPSLASTSAVGWQEHVATMLPHPRRKPRRAAGRFRPGGVAAARCGSVDAALDGVLAMLSRLDSTPGAPPLAHLAFVTQPICGSTHAPSRMPRAELGRNPGIRRIRSRALGAVPQDRGWRRVRRRRHRLLCRERRRLPWPRPRQSRWRIPRPRPPSAFGLAPPNPMPRADFAPTPGIRSRALDLLERLTEPDPRRAA